MPTKTLWRLVSSVMWGLLKGFEVIYETKFIGEENQNCHPYFWIYDVEHSKFDR